MTHNQEGRNGESETQVVTWEVQPCANLFAVYPMPYELIPHGYLFGFATEHEATMLCRALNKLPLYTAPPPRPAAGDGVTAAAGIVTDVMAEAARNKFAYRVFKHNQNGFRATSFTVDTEDSRAAILATGLPDEIIELTIKLNAKENELAKLWAQVKDQSVAINAIGEQNTQLEIDNAQLRAQLAALESRLQAAEKLPQKWRDESAAYVDDAARGLKSCARELIAALARSQP